MEELRQGMKIEKAGSLDTIQDLGRWSYQAYGMVVAGAMDPFAYQIGNILLGNKGYAASLEMTLLGPRVTFSQPTQIVITGADMSPKVNESPIPMWQTIDIRENDHLTFGPAKKGCRSYLAIAGGFRVPTIMGSRSTYLRGKIGGYHGRALDKGDIIPYLTLADTDPKRLCHSALARSIRPEYKDEVEVRVILGPQDHYFTQEGIDTFFKEEYFVTPQMDRMGIRLEGAVIQHTAGADIISDAIPLGAIQIPANGKPIILMSDRQTTGGYTKIGCVISVDIPTLAQVRPGQKIRFREVSIEAAQSLLKEQVKGFISLNLLQPHLPVMKKY